MSGNLSPSLIRTLVPFLVGPLVTRYGIDPNDPEVALVASAAIGYAYYVLARLLEVFGGPKWGYILGFAKAPGYSSDDPPAPPPGDGPEGELEGGMVSLEYLGQVLVILGVVLIVVGVLTTLSLYPGIVLTAVGLVLVLVDGSSRR